MSDICPLCEAEGAPVVFSAHAQMYWVVKDRALTDRFLALDIRQCRVCGHVFNTALDPAILTELYRRQTATNRPVSPAMSARYRTLLDFLGRERIVGRRLLEVGGGTGSLARLLAGFGAEVTVVEPNDKLEELLGDSAPGIRTVNAFFGPDTLDAVFDGVICRQVVEHIADARGFVRALSAAVAPGGFAYIEVPTLEFIAASGAYMDLHIQHLHYFDAASRTRLLAGAGLEIEAVLDIMDGHDTGLLAVPSRARPCPAEPSAQAPSRHLSLDAARHRRDAHIGFLERFQGAPGRMAVYGATAQGVAFYNQFAPGRAPGWFMDDNPDYWQRYAYGRGGVAAILPYGDSLMGEPEDIFIGAYHHEPAIVEKLSRDGFRGRVWSIHPRHPGIERIAL